MRKPLYGQINNSISTLTDTTDSVTIASNAAINFNATSQYSWIGRIKIINYNSNQEAVLVIKTSDAVSGYLIQFSFEKLSFQERKGFTSWFSEQAIPNLLNQWHDFAVTFDGTAQVIKMYIDGVLIDSQIGSFNWSNVVSNTTTAIQLGVNNIGENGVMNMSNFASYSRILTQAEISAFSQGGIVPTGSMMYWVKMDEGLSFSPADYSGNGLTVSQSAAAMWQSDAPSKHREKVFQRTNSLAFNGSSDFATCPIAPSTIGWSISFWVNPVEDTNFSRVFSYADANSNGTRFLLNNPSNRFFTFDIGAGTSLSSTNSTTGTLKAGVWTHIVVTFDGTTNTQVFINGVLNAFATTRPYANPVGQTFTLGRDSKSSANFGKFLLSDFVYKSGVPFTQSEINGLYYKNALPAGVTCNITCDGNVTDQSGNGNDLTLSGTTYSTNVRIKNRLVASGRRAS